MLRITIKKYQSSYRGLPLSIWLLSFIVFINKSGSMVLFYLVLYLTEKCGHSVIQAGYVISVYGIGSVVGSLMGGILNDYIGSFTVQIASLFISGGLFILVKHFESFLIIAIIMFFVGLTVAIFRPANAAAISRLCPEESLARGYALNRLFLNLGMTISPAVGGMLARYNYSYLFWVDGLTCIVAAIIFCIVLMSFDLGDIIDTKRMKKKQYKNKSIIHDKIFLTIMCLLFFLLVVYMQRFNTWALYLRNVCHLMEHKIGILLAINALLVVLFGMPLIHILEKFNKLIVIAIGSLLICSGFSLLPISLHYFYIVITVIVWTIGEMMVFPVLSSYSASRSNKENRGRYMGIQTFVFSLAFAVSPAIGTRVYSLLGFNKLWLIIGLTGVLICTCFVIIHNISAKSNISDKSDKTGGIKLC